MSNVVCECPLAAVTRCMPIMVIRVVEFSSAPTKLDRFLPKNQQLPVELILKVPFFLTILWDELLSKNLGIFVLCTKMTRLSQELTSVNS
jgi:hypothetical protein